MKEEKVRKARKAKKAKVEKAEVTKVDNPMVTKVDSSMVTVKDLAVEFQMKPKEIRLILREEGFKAPAVDRPKGTFGPKLRYEWPLDSEDLVRIRTVLIGSKDNEDE